MVVQLLLSPNVIQGVPGGWEERFIYSRHQLWRKWQPDLIPRYDIFLLSMHHAIFEGTFAAAAIGGDPYCEFSNPTASAPCNHFFNFPDNFFNYPLILRAFRSYRVCTGALGKIPIGWVGEILHDWGTPSRPHTHRVSTLKQALACTHDMSRITLQIINLASFSKPLQT